MHRLLFGILALNFFGLIWSFRETQTGKTLIDQVVKMEITAHERTSFRDEYLLYRNERAQNQWESLSSQLSLQLQELSPLLTSPEAREALAGARTNFEDTRTLFHRIGSTTDPEFQKRLHSQLLLRASRLLSFTGQLHQMAQENLEFSYYRLIALMASFVLLTIAAISVSGSLIRRARIENERQFELLMNAAPVAMLAFQGENQRTFRMNQKFVELFGYSLADIPSAAHWWSRAIPDTANPDIPLDRESFHSTIHCKDGTLRQVEFHLSRMNDFLLLALIDLTDRVRLEARLHEAQVAMDGMGDAVYWVNPDASVFNVNRAATRMLGYTHEELTRLSIPQFSSSFTAETWKPHIERLRRERSHRIETIHFTKDGHEVPVEVRANHFIVGGREFICAITRDISERKNHEKNLLRAYEAANAANQAKGQFLANMSHELRTPLTPILGMADLLSMTPLNPQQRTYVEIIKNSGTTLIDLINEILDMSKVEAGDFELRSEPFDLRALLAELHRTHLIKAEAKNLGFRLELSDDTPTLVHGDRRRLAQCLGNLIGNAIKFTHAGEISVWVRPSSEDPGKIQFSVKDTGIGIAPEKQRAIFDPFTQGDESFTREYGGTGLGLTITERLVSLMRGRIWLESQPNRGSTFHFSAELSTVPAPSQDSKRPQASPQ